MVSTVGHCSISIIHTPAPVWSQDSGMNPLYRAANLILTLTKLQKDHQSPFRICCLHTLYVYALSCCAVAGRLLLLAQCFVGGCISVSAITVHLRAVDEVLLRCALTLAGKQCFADRVWLQCGLWYSYWPHGTVWWQPLSMNETKTSPNPKPNITE